MTLLLKNARYIDRDNLHITEGDILVYDGENGGILVNPAPDAINKVEISELIDCSGKYVTHSFGIGHHHAYSALATGMPAPSITPNNFHEILQYIWWKLDKSLTKEIIESSALVTAIAAAKAGSTFIIDHHASPFAVEGSLETIASAFDKVGVSHLLCYEISDRDGEKVTAAGLAETENYLRIRPGLVGLHAAFTVGDDTLSKAVKLMEKYNSGVHIHVAEDKYDQEYSESRYGKRVLKRLEESGVLNSPKTILAHCLHLEPFEREIISTSKAWVVQNCESNLNNNVGYFSGDGLGDNIMLGTDGMHSDMLRGAKATFFSGQRYDNLTYPGIYERFRNVHKYLIENRFSGDGNNNLVVLDYNPATPLTTDNFCGHFLFGFNASDISHVISNGRLIVKDGLITTVDTDSILAKSREHASFLWKQMSTLTPNP